MSLKSRNQKRKIRSLKSQLSFYRSTLVDMAEIMSEYENEWARDEKIILDKLLQDTNHNDIEKSQSALQNTKKIVDFTMPPTEENLDSNIEENIEEKPTPDWAKKLYRKIARRTHPDITKENHDNESSRIFQEAVTIMERKSYDSLIDLALDLNIDVDIDSPIIIKKLSERIKITKDKISKMEASLPWVWGESFGLYNIRLKVISVFLERLGETKLSDIEISNLIKEIEGKSVE
jgi:hypothetical protein